MALIGFVLFFSACFVVANMAGRRGRSRILYGGATVVGGFILVLFANVNFNDGMASALSAFIAPLIGFAIAASSPTVEKQPPNKD